MSTLWDLVNQGSQNETENKGNEVFLFICGQQYSGKTHLINSFLQKEDPVKPTTAMEYSYARKGGSVNLLKHVVHIWELAGGLKFTDLLTVTMNPYNISCFNLIIVLDLSEPCSIWNTIETILEATKSRLSKILSRLNKEDSTRLRASLKKSLEKRYLASIEDQPLCDYFPLPLTIFGTKYDLYSNTSASNQDVIQKTLRYISHYLGASLYFVSTRDKDNLCKIRRIFNHIAFNDPLDIIYNKDTCKPLIIPHGCDSFSEIGTILDPDSINEKIRKMPDSLFNLWKTEYNKRFPPASQSSNVDNDPAYDKKYAEISIDEIRKQKDMEYEKFKDAAEKEFREDLQFSFAKNLFNV